MVGAISTLHWAHNEDVTRTKLHLEMCYEDEAQGDDGGRTLLDLWLRDAVAYPYQLIKSL